jgi:hypothetical protein
MVTDINKSIIMNSFNKTNTQQDQQTTEQIDVGPKLTDFNDLYQVNELLSKDLEPIGNKESELNEIIGQKDKQIEDLQQQLLH